MSMIDIGGLKEESIRYRVEAITAIMNHPAGDSVKVAALQSLATMLSVGDVSIQNCHFESGGDSGVKLT
jgi:hypothetical protein